MRLSEHFTLDEMTFSQTAARDNIDNTPSPEIIKNLIRLCALLEDVRKTVGKPITVTSGYRSPEVNRLIGSKDTSQHCKGCAADIKIGRLSVDESMDAIIKSGIIFDQCIAEYNSWIHISVPNKPDGIPRMEKFIIDHNGTRKYG